CVLLIFLAAATTPIYTLSLHDALPIWGDPDAWPSGAAESGAHGTVARARVGGPARTEPSTSDVRRASRHARCGAAVGGRQTLRRSEEHTSELQSRENLVCRLLLEKKKR